jgi:hypothetical protein
MFEVSAVVAHFADNTLEAKVALPLARASPPRAYFLPNSKSNLPGVACGLAGLKAGRPQSWARF